MDWNTVVELAPLLPKIGLGLTAGFLAHKVIFREPEDIMGGTRTVATSNSSLATALGGGVSTGLMASSTTTGSALSAQSMQNAFNQAQRVFTTDNAMWQLRWSQQPAAVDRWDTDTVATDFATLGQWNGASVATPAAPKAKEISKADFSKIQTDELLVKDMEPGLVKIEGDELKNRVMEHLK